MKEDKDFSRQGFRRAQVGAMALYGTFVSGIRQNWGAGRISPRPFDRLINHIAELPRMACGLHYPQRDQERRPVRVGSRAGCQSSDPGEQRCTRCAKRVSPWCAGAHSFLPMGMRRRRVVAVSSLANRLLARSGYSIDVLTLVSSRQVSAGKDFQLDSLPEDPAVMV